MELIIGDSMAARYKVYRQKSIAFLCTGNEQLEFQIKDLKCLYQHPKIICLGTNLTNVVQYLFVKNCDVLIKVQINGKLFYVYD